VSRTTTIPFTQKEPCEDEVLADQSNVKVILDCDHNGITLTGDCLGEQKAAEVLNGGFEEVRTGSGEASQSEAQAHEESFPQLVTRFLEDLEARLEEAHNQELRSLLAEIARQPLPATACERQPRQPGEEARPSSLPQ
jgi:hypothetical protein